MKLIDKPKCPMCNTYFNTVKSGFSNCFSEKSENIFTNKIVNLD
jgi:hypothetical protein